MAEPLPIDWTAVRLAAIAGRLSYKELGEQFGIKEETIRQRAKREGWTQTEIKSGEALGNVVSKAKGFQGSGNQGLTEAVTAVTDSCHRTVTAVSRAVTDVWAQRREESQDEWHDIAKRGRRAIARMGDDEIIASIDKAAKLMDMDRKNLGLDKDAGNKVQVAIGLLTDNSEEADEGEELPIHDLEVEEVPLGQSEGDGMETR